MKKEAAKKPKKIDALTISQPFAAYVRKSKEKLGTKVLVMKSPKFYQHQINKFRDGEQVTLYISNQRPKRTLQQNAYYWGVYLPLISAQTGEPNLDRLHELFKGMFLTTEIAEVLGHKVRIKKSTAALSISEFSDYIMKIQSETGIEAPPTENYDMFSLEDGLKEKDEA